MHNPRAARHFAKEVRHAESGRAASSVRDAAGQLPAGSLAYSCDVPPLPLEAGATPQQAIFPPGQYPVSLPAASLLGARNDLPNPYQPGVDFGELPSGRKWGSTASVTTGPDNTIWVIDRCGNSGAGGKRIEIAPASAPR